MGSRQGLRRKILAQQIWKAKNCVLEYSRLVSCYIFSCLVEVLNCLASRLKWLKHQAKMMLSSTSWVRRSRFGNHCNLPMKNCFSGSLLTASEELNSDIQQWSFLGPSHGLQPGLWSAERSAGGVSFTSSLSFWDGEVEGRGWSLSLIPAVKETWRSHRVNPDGKVREL